MKHLKYLKYIIVHKWFVMLACFRYGLIWQGIVHDWSKLLPSEWFPYVENFYGYKPTDRDRQRSRSALGYDCYPSSEWVEARFNRAWLNHQHRSPHHWQHWILREDSGKTINVEMPRRYVLEMIADWEGAGRAIAFTSGMKSNLSAQELTWAWYARNRDKMQLHTLTRKLVDRAMDYDDSVPF